MERHGAGGVEALGAVIPAAGLSSRMGAFKPLLEIGGETLIGRVISMARLAGAGKIVVVTGHRGDELEERLSGSGAVFVRNERFRETGIFDSLLLGLDALGGECGRVLISPADLPFVKPETVRGLLQADGGFVRPMYRGQPGHPVLIRAEIIPIIRRYKGEGGLRGAARFFGINATEVDMDDQGVVADCDTPKDYENFLKRADIH